MLAAGAQASPRLSEAMIGFDGLAAPAQIFASTPSFVIRPATAVTVFENEPVTLQLEASGGESAQPYIYFVSPAIPNASLDSETGLYKFLPSFIQAATYEVEFTADNISNRLTQSAVIGVRDNNRPPSMQISFSDELAVNEGQTARFEAFAIDPDTDNTLIYSVTPAVANLSLATETGSFVFRPDFTQAGVYSIVISVTDGTAEVSRNRTLRVNNVNRTPTFVLNPAGDRTVMAGETFNLLAFAADPDEEPLTLSATGLPPNSTFDPASGRFSFTPDLSQFREQYVVEFTANDTVELLSRSIVLTVDADVEPIWEFNNPNDLEGWSAFQHIENLQIVNGALEGFVRNGDPILFRSGLDIDSFSQFELVIRFAISPPSPFSFYVITDDGSFLGPVDVRNIDPTGFQTVSVDLSPLFDRPRVIESLRIDPGFLPISKFFIDYVGIARSEFPERQPTPTFTPSPTRTPTITPTPTVTPTLTPTPGTPTLTPTPSPTPEPFLARHTFDDTAVLRDEFSVQRPAGYQPATVLLADAPAAEGFSGRAVKIFAQPGQGAVVMARTASLSTVEPIYSQVNAWVDSASASVALLSMNSPIDGQFGYNIAMSGGYPLSLGHVMQSIYSPPGRQVTLALQASQAFDASGPATIFFDNLIAERLGSISRIRSPLQPEGGFDGDLSGLIVNIAGDKGGVQVRRDSLIDNSIVLSANPSAPSANVGAFSSANIESLTGLQQVEIDYHRISGAGGAIDFLFTDGRSAFGQTALGSLASATETRTLTIGGSFYVQDPFITPIVLIQNANPLQQGSIQFDDMAHYQIDRR